LVLIQCLENFRGVILYLMKTFIPVAEPFLGDLEANYILDSVKSGWVSSVGRYVNLFEESLANYCNTKYAITTSSGTTALHLALVAAGIGPGDEVIIPSLTFVATANSIIYAGAKPVFIDSELVSWNIDPEKIKEKINRRTKAIMVVHLYGHPANMKPISAIARKYGLLLIEDAAEAHGALYANKKVGSIGDIGCFSFYGNKIITTGEGGAIVSSNKDFINKARNLRDHGTNKKRRYYNPQIGFNYRMTNLQAALGCAQLEKIDQIIDRKRQIAKLYTNYLQELTEITVHPEADWAKNVFWMYSILIKDKRKDKNRDFLIKQLMNKGIDSRPFFFPLHRLSRFNCTEKMPVADYLAGSGINLPSSVNLSDDQIKFICQNILKVFNNV
jgi:perosamine synthetase